MRRVTLKQKGEYELSQLNSHLFLDAVPLRLEHIFQDRASIKQGVIVFRVVQKVNTVYPRIGHLLKVFQSLFNILSLRVFNVSSRSVQHIYGLVDLGQYSPRLFICLASWVVHSSINRYTNRNCSGSQCECACIQLVNMWNSNPNDDGSLIYYIVSQYYYY